MKPIQELFLAKEQKLLNIVLTGTEAVSVPVCSEMFIWLTAGLSGTQPNDHFHRKQVLHEQNEPSPTPTQHELWSWYTLLKIKRSLITQKKMCD